MNYKKFKVGDIVIAKSNSYGVTSTDNDWVGEVVEVGADDMRNLIEVRTVSAKDPEDLNQTTYWVPAKHFALQSRKLELSTPKKTRKRRKSKYGNVGTGSTLLQIAKSFKVTPRKPVTKAPKEDQELDLCIAWAKGDISITQVGKAMGMKHINTSTYMWILNTFKRHFNN